MDDQVSPMELLLIEQKVTNEGPSLGVAYLLCICLGWFSAHRFYLGRPGSAFLQLASWLILIQPIQWIVDLFLLPGMVRKRRQQMRNQMIAARGLAVPAPA